MRWLPLLTLPALSGCFLTTFEAFEGTWIGSFQGTRAGGVPVMYSLRVDWSPIVDDRLTADVWLEAVEADLDQIFMPGRVLRGRAFGKPTKFELSANVPVRLLDGSTHELGLFAKRSAVEEDSFEMEVTWPDEPQSVVFSRPLGDRWDLDTGDPMQGGTLPQGTGSGTGTGAGTGTGTGTGATTDTGTPTGGTPPTGAAHFGPGAHLFGNAPHVLNAAFTVDAWVVADTPDDLDLMGIVSWGEPGCAGLDLFADQRRPNLGTDTVLQGGGLVTDGAWHHVSVAWDGAGSWTMFVDGQQVFVMNACFDGYLAPTLWVGATRGGASSWQGRIDEVRVWDRALSYAESTALPTTVVDGSEAGLVGWWSLDDVGTGMARNGAVTGAPFDLVVVGAVTEAAADH